MFLWGFAVAQRLVGVTLETLEWGRVWTVGVPMHPDLPPAISSLDRLCFCHLYVPLRRGPSFAHVSYLAECSA